MSKKIIKIAIFLIITSFLTTCKKDFLYEKSPLLETDVTSIQSFIVVLPDEDAENYPLIYKNADNLKFKITQKPEWLILDSKEGKFVNDTAWIKCSAKKQALFSKTGIYYDFMQIKDENGNEYPVEVAYVTEGNPKIGVAENINVNILYNNNFQITNNADGILIWEIVECSEWLYVTPKNNSNSTENKEKITHGIIKPFGSCGLSIKIKEFKNKQDILEYTSGQIVILSNDKNNPQKIINIHVDFGDPEIQFYNTEINFGKSETEITRGIKNNFGGILVWYLTDLPEWLSCSKTSGYIEYWDYDYISFTVNRHLVPDAITKATIYLRSNSVTNSNIPITVIARKYPTTNPSNVIGIEGDVKDTWFDKSTNKLYYITTQPNKFIEFNINSKTVERSLNLTKEPNCFSVSEDGTKAVVGYNGAVTLINMSNFKITKTINVSQQIFDIEIYDSDNAVYTEEGNSVNWTYLFFLNLTTEELTNNVDSNNDIYESCMIKKIPNKNYVVASETHLSSGFYVYDLATKTQKSKIFGLNCNFWFIKNTEHILLENGEIYSTSGILNQNEHTSGLSVLDDLKMQGQYYFHIINADYCNVHQNLWALISNEYFKSPTNKIIQFEPNDYSEIKTLFATDYCVKNGIEYDVDSRYLFVNQQGTELIVFRNATNGTTAWSIEFINIQ